MSSVYYLYVYSHTTVHCMGSDKHDELCQTGPAACRDDRPHAGHRRRKNLLGPKPFPIPGNNTGHMLVLFPLMVFVYHTSKNLDIPNFFLRIPKK